MAAIDQTNTSAIRGINLGIGELSGSFFEEPENAARHYAPPEGIEALRALVAKRESVDITEVCITTGASMGLVAALADVERPATILCPVPYYPAYPKAIESTGHQPIFYRVEPDRKRGSIDHDLARLVRHDTRAIIVNSPGNPLGNVASADDLYRICSVSKSRYLKVILDEVYAPFAFEEPANAAVALGGTDLLRLGSLSKEFGFPGDRIGYVLASREVVKRVTRIHWSLAMNAPVTGQLRAIRALSNEDRRLQVRKQLRESRDVAVDALKSVRKVEFVAPDAGFFLWVVCPTWTAAPRALSDYVAANGIRVMSSDTFGFDKPAFRASFAYDPNTVRAAFEKLASILIKI